MLTHVHVGIALIGAAAVSPHDWRVATLAGIGGFLPDLPAWIQLAWDVSRGRKPFGQCGNIYWRSYWTLHSMLLMLPTLIVPPLAWGIYTHIVVDILSHKRRVLTMNGWQSVNSYCWPFQWWLPYLFDGEGANQSRAALWVQHALAAALFAAFALLMWW